MRISPTEFFYSRFPGPTGLETWFLRTPSCMFDPRVQSSQIHFVSGIIPIRTASDIHVCKRTPLHCRGAPLLKKIWNRHVNETCFTNLSVVNFSFTPDCRLVVKTALRLRPADAVHLACSSLSVCIYEGNLFLKCSTRAINILKMF